MELNNEVQIDDWYQKIAKKYGDPQIIRKCVNKATESECKDYQLLFNALEKTFVNQAEHSYNRQAISNNLEESFYIVQPNEEFSFYYYPAVRTKIELAVLCGCDCLVQQFFESEKSHYELYELNRIIR